MAGSITQTHSRGEVESSLLTGSRQIVPHNSTHLQIFAEENPAWSSMLEKSLRCPFWHQVPWTRSHGRLAGLFGKNSENWNSSKNFKRRQVRFSMIQFDIQKILYSISVTSEIVKHVPRRLAWEGTSILLDASKTNTIKYIKTLPPFFVQGEKFQGQCESGEKDLQDYDRLLRNVNRSIGSLGSGLLIFLARLLQGTEAALSMLWFGRLPRRCPCLWSCRGLPCFDRMSWKPLRQIAAL